MRRSFAGARQPLRWAGAGLLAVVCASAGGCKSSAAHQSSPSPASGTVALPSDSAGAGWVTPDRSLPPFAGAAVGRHKSCSNDASKTHAAAKNLPRASGHDVQCLADPLAVLDPGHAGAVLGYHVVTDPTSASRTLSSAVLGTFQAQLESFDKAAYAQGDGTAPDFVVAVATPKDSAAGVNFVGSVMSGFQATDLFTPTQKGSNALALYLTIGCGQDAELKRTVCAWQGVQKSGHDQRFFGVLMFSAPMSSGRAESFSEAVLGALAPAA